MKIKMFWVGKTKSPALRTLQEDYLKRIRRWVSCETVEIRDLAGSRALSPAELVAGEGAAITRRLPADGRVVALDESGEQFSSTGFAQWLESEQNSGTRSLSFLIGGPAGLSPDLAWRADRVLSLGRMTWTHDMSRVLLLEQVYRALCILRHVPYHRGD
ncbi:MAG: 23S rRNA (pseudouridine(1915)-N(3))-methyltransferase RlmH [Acidobacteriota bacterium]|jgi:23S rRNA (pseudouridine1915-N3)-methyltransferase|nr:23S rRNA (pseudouridine(1915)-N(3))-methyltransferase RlmH [Acidobacteriota bacterium]NLT32351.1 23S rRNA (pseudouridine(1915)-N(3))-methyltransferase RlmH [Acidobacteriota bacterium]